MLRAIKVSLTDETMFRRSAALAREGNHRVRVGAVLAKGRREISSAINLPGDNERHLTGHAERRAIDGQPAIKGTLYVARLALNDEPAPSWPCAECLIHIKACSCVTKIVYFDGSALVKVRI